MPRSLFLLLALLPLPSFAAAPPTVRVSNIRCVFHDGHHNAFTDLTRWNDQYWLTFRSCPDGHMIHPGSSILILNSNDAQNWNVVHRFSVPRRDTRDPHFLVFADKLFVYTGTWYCGDSSPDPATSTLNEHLGYAAWTADGRTWQSPVMLEGTYGHYIWRAAAHDGKAYLCGRRNGQFQVVPRGQRDIVESALLESDDGLIFRKRALFQEQHGNETAFLFQPDGTILGIGRCTPVAQLLTSAPPYTQWQRIDFDRYIGGPLIARWGDRYIVGGRKSGQAFVGNRGPKTSLYFLNPDADTPADLLTEFAELPSGGDNSYPGFIPLSPTEALVSWYSTHETDPTRGQPITAIYLADLITE